MATEEPEAHHSDPPRETHSGTTPRLLQRRRLVVAVFTGRGCRALRTFLTAPSTRARAAPHREDRPNVLSFKGVTEERAASDRRLLPTQYKLLQSRSLARRVVEKVGLLSDPAYGGRARRRRWTPSSRSPRPEPELEGRSTASSAASASGPSATAASSTSASLLPAGPRRRPPTRSRRYIEQSLDQRFNLLRGRTWLNDQIKDQQRKVEELGASSRPSASARASSTSTSAHSPRAAPQGARTALNERKTERLQKEACGVRWPGRHPEELPTSCAAASCSRFASSSPTSSGSRPSSSTLLDQHRRS